MNLELDALCDDFEAALERGERPAISDWAKSEAAIPELAALELHHRLIAGEVVTAADYFAMYPQLLANREVAVRLVGVEYRAAVSRDSSLTERHFRERYPDLANGQEWSNGPWVSDTAVVAGTGTLIQQLPPKAPSVPTVKVDMPDFLANILQSPFAQHPDDIGRLGEYRVIEVLDRGGMGVVLKGANIHSGHPAAIKLMLPEAAAQGRERFLREARAAHKIDDQRVVPIYHVGEVNGAPYIVMKLLEGQSLAKRLKEGPPLSMDEIIRIGREIAEGLKAAHTLDLVHRDLKPDNIWMETTKDGEHVRILDFGLARPIGNAAVDGVRNVTIGNVVAGTPAYMSPEQAESHELDARTDLWSLGVVLYRLVANQLPFGDSSVTKVLRAIVDNTPKPLHEANSIVPMRLSNLVMKLLEKQPKNRHSSAEAVIAEFKQIEAASLVPDGTTITYVSPDAKPRKSRRWWPMGITAAVITLVIGFITLMPSREPSTTVSMKPMTPIAPVTPPPVEPLAVKFIAVKHYENLTPEMEVPRVESRGILGKESFQTKLLDRIRVEVELSRPAYCYVVAFNPDGMSELISPEKADANVPPLLLDRPQYPSKVPEDYYGLTDGTGMCVIGVVASPSPLPSFAKSTEKKPPPQLKISIAETNTVWRLDGAWPESLTPTGRKQSVRGGGSKAEDANGITAVTTWLKSIVEDKDAATSAISFAVQPR